jgi:hypothetical protein
VGEARRKQAQERADLSGKRTPGSGQIPQSSEITLPQRVLDDISGEFDGYWKLVERVRRSPKDALMNAPARHWQPYCFVPVNVVSGAVFKLLRGRMSSDEVEFKLSNTVRALTAVTAWRMTKGVYTFDPDVLNALVDSDVEDEVPEELLVHLPEWCPYIATPGVEIMPGVGLHGFFAYVDDRAWGNSRPYPPELNFELIVDPARCSGQGLMLASLADPFVFSELTSDDDGLIAAAEEIARTREYLHFHLNVALGQGAFTKALKGEALRISEQCPEGSFAANPSLRDVVAVQFAQMQARLCSLLLYLVSEEPDIPEGASAARDQVRRNDRQGIRNFQAQRIQRWEVGFRIGAQIRAARNAAARASTAGDGTHAAPAPHIRRAHWHIFWKGKKDGSEARHKIARWLPPIPVNVHDVDNDLVPTVHAVQSGRRTRLQ